MMDDRMSTLDRENNRAYFLELGGSLAAYAVVLVGSLTLYDLSRPTATNVALMLLPVVPAVGVAWACMRMLARSDEFQRAQQLEAIAIGFVLAMLAAVTLGFLSQVVDVTGAPWIVYGIGMGGWALGAIARGRA